MREALRRTLFRTREQLGNNGAQTVGKTGEQDRPESRTNQQDGRPGPVCKTSIPGSNPGGASKIPRKIAWFVPQQRKRMRSNWTTVDYRSTVHRRSQCRNPLIQNVLKMR
jgi:hypothetical protein